MGSSSVVVVGGGGGGGGGECKCMTFPMRKMLLLPANVGLSKSADWEKKIQNQSASLHACLKGTAEILTKTEEKPAQIDYRSCSMIFHRLFVSLVWTHSAAITCPSPSVSCRNWCLDLNASLFYRLESSSGDSAMHFAGETADFA